MFYYLTPYISTTITSSFVSRTTHKPACQSAHQQFLSAVRKALYLAPFSYCGICSAVRACSWLFLSSEIIQFQHILKGNSFASSKIFLLRVKILFVHFKFHHKFLKLPLEVLLYQKKGHENVYLFYEQGQIIQKLHQLLYL